MTLGELIEAIGPLNNQFRDTNGIERIEVLWEIGDVVQTATHGPLDELLWQIQERSFITRDLLRYASIVRRGWPEKASLRQQFGKVSSYTLFREALPFLKGDRQGIDEKTFNRVVEAISSGDVARAREFLRRLKKEHIGKKHRKGISRAKVDDLVQTIMNWVDDFRTGIAEDPVSKAKSLREAYGQSLALMGKLAYAFATGGTIPLEALRELEEKCTHVLVKPVVVAGSGTREERNAFVKGVGANLFVELADLFGALRDDLAFAQWLRRSHISLHIQGNQNGES